MSRWKLWRKVDGENVPAWDDPRAKSAEIKAVVYTVPAPTRVRECRVVTVGLEHDGAVRVSHEVTVVPEGDENGAIYPTTSSEVYVPGWEPDEWEDTE